MVIKNARIHKNLRIGKRAAQGKKMYPSHLTIKEFHATTREPIEEYASHFKVDEELL